MLTWLKAGFRISVKQLLSNSVGYLCTHTSIFDTFFKKNKNELIQLADLPSPPSSEDNTCPGASELIRLSLDTPVSNFSSNRAVSVGLVSSQSPS